MSHLKSNVVSLTMSLQAWRDEGLTLSSSSNEACKLYDAILTQVHASNTAVTHSTMCQQCVLL